MTRSPIDFADRLTSPVAAYINTRLGTDQVAVFDVSTGATWQLGNPTAQDSASIVKVDVLAALLYQHEEGGVPLSTTDLASATKMIEYSDNDSATSLWGAIGGPPGLAAFNARVGLSETDPSSCVICPGFPWPGWGLTTTTSTDQIRLLRSVVLEPSILQSEGQAMLIGLMRNVTASERWGITGGVPSGVSIAIKDGWLPLNEGDTDWQVNSIGWVQGQSRDYLIAVLTTGNPTEQYGIDTIDSISSLVWNGLAP